MQCIMHYPPPPHLALVWSYYLDTHPHILICIHTYTYVCILHIFMLYIACSKTGLLILKCPGEFQNEWIGLPGMHSSRALTGILWHSHCMHRQAHTHVCVLNVPPTPFTHKISSCVCAVEDLHRVLLFLFSSSRWYLHLPLHSLVLWASPSALVRWVSQYNAIITTCSNYNVLRRSA